MRELAIRLGTTRQTVTAWLDKWPDFPVHERGTNGREYKFDLAGVVTFLRARKEEEAANAAARDQALAQLTLPLDDEKPAPAPGLSIRDQLDAQKLRKLQREDAIAEGRLVEVMPLIDHLGTAFQALHRSLHTAVRNAAREHNLPDAVARAIDGHIAETQRAFVRALPQVLKGIDTDVG